MNKSFYAVFSLIAFLTITTTCHSYFDERGAGKPPSENDIFPLLPFKKTISQSDFANNTTYTISRPDQYILAGSISATPTSGNIISITTSNVVLNLNGNCIEQGDSTSGISVINIATGLSNITIKNGTIKNATNYGIYIANNCRNIKIKNIVVDGCNKEGIMFNGSTGNSITDCEVTNVGVINCDGSELAEGSAESGLYLKQCKNIRLSNSFFNNNQTSSVTSSRTTYGVYMETTTGCHFDNCEAIGNLGGAAYGFYTCSNSLANIFSDCLSAENTGTAACDTAGTGGQGCGFCVDTCAATIFENCTALSNLSTTTAYGFLLLTSTANEILNCKANRQKTVISNTDEEGSGDAHGIYLAGGQDNIVKNCIANGNIGGSNAYHFATGIRLDVSQGVNESRCQIIECEASSNNGQSGTGIGIHLANVGTCTTIIGNKTFTNTADTAANHYGIKDNSTDSTALIMKNLSYGHNLSGSGTNNFSIDYTGGPTFTPVSGDITDITNTSGIDNSDPIFQNIDMYVPS